MVRLAAIFLFLLIIATNSLVGCAARPANGQDIKCAKGLDMAYAELEQAKANGFSSSIALTKAAGLLFGAKTQQQFDKWPNCINKVKRARFYIKQAQTK